MIQISFARTSRGGQISEALGCSTLHFHPSERNRFTVTRIDLDHLEASPPTQARRRRHFVIHDEIKAELAHAINEIVADEIAVGGEGADRALRVRWKMEDCPYDAALLGTLPILERDVGPNVSEPPGPT